jgi:hypothetical protein
LEAQKNLLADLDLQLQLEPGDLFLDPSHFVCWVVPGPYKPKDFNSFLWPLVEELFKLTAGIKAFDLSSNKIFILHAFLILVFGDIPTVSMVM